MIQRYVVIVAGGSGKRFKSETPKQFIELCGKPILMHTLEAFYIYDNELQIIVVLPNDQINFWKELCEKYDFSINHEIVVGGKVRFHSVKNGLSKIDSNSIVAIHDGVRPLIDSKTIKTCFEEALKSNNAIPSISPVDSMRKIDGQKNKHVNRDNFKLIQTPQVFKSNLLIKAYEQEYSEIFTDDASVFEAVFPNSINLVEGNRQNVKITSPEDLIYAEAIMIANHNNQ